MARFRARMRATINSIKHYVQNSSALIAAGTVTNVTVAESVVAPATANTAEVVQGSVLKAAYLEQWILSNQNSTGPIQFVLVVSKLPNGISAPTFTNMLNLSAWTNKSNILYTTQGIVSDKVESNSIPLIRQWFLIPKGKQRMALGDSIDVSIAALDNLRFCGFLTYKEYR